MSKSPDQKASDSCSDSDKDSSVECPNCSKSYGHSSNLARHMKDCCPEKMCECPTCGNLFKNQRGMRHHHGRTHGESLVEFETECDNCGEKTTYDIHNTGEHKFCDEECKNEWQKTLTGKDHPSWEGGHITYYGSNWREMRDKTLERDNHQCQDCGDDGWLDVHHITPIDEFDTLEDANTLLNLITLCRDCHRNKWEGLYLRPDPR